MNKAISFQEKFQKLSETWTPKILTRFDDYYVKTAKMLGEFVCHSHRNADERFIVISGKLRILSREDEAPLKARDNISKHTVVHEE